MPFDSRVVPKRLVQAAKHHNLVPLIGAGISKQASPMFPTWRELLGDMKNQTLQEGLMHREEVGQIDALIDKGQFLMVAEDLRYRLPTDLYKSILESKFNPPGVKPAAIHSSLFEMKPPLILTTNYDRLIEHAYASTFQRAPTTLTYRDADAVQRRMQAGFLPEDPIIFKLHGSIEDPDAMIISERDYRELIYRQPGYRIVLSAVFLTRVVLMLGFSLDDQELRLLLETHRESLKYGGNPDYVFLSGTSPSSVEGRRLRQDYGVQVIPYEASPGHPEVLQFVNYLVDQTKGGQAK